MVNFLMKMCMIRAFRLSRNVDYDEFSAEDVQVNRMS